MSLKKSIMIYILIFAVSAIILSALTAGFCNWKVQKINDSYPPVGERYYLTNEKGERLNESTYIYKEISPMSERDERRVAVLETIPIVAIPIYSALCIMAAAFLFYRSKLKEPLAELKEASEKISNNDLDFKINYHSGDEMGQLCASYEAMRSALYHNFSEMWRQVEERRELNAAFAHDLRTPLTVLKGYNEMLQGSESEKTRKTAETMGKHISRMENYIASMSSIRRMEDAEPEYQHILLQPFLESINKSSDMICRQNGKILYFENNVSASQLYIDTSFISQVCDNLISNAVRYAKTAVTLTFECKGGGLLLCVSDDGKGFDKSSLHKVAEPYFTEEKDRSEHFGLGLYICKLLCRNHGGWLKAENTSKGAKVSAYFKSPDVNTMCR